MVAADVATRTKVTLGLETEEAVEILADGTAVVSGLGGPLVGPNPNPLGTFYPQGVTAGYGPNGTLLWEGYSSLPAVWGAALPNGDVCATGGYDALITCFDVSGGGVIGPLEPVARMTATPSTGTAPLTVAFDGRGSIPGPNPLVSWTWSFGDGSSGSGVQATHVYSTPGTFVASLTVTDSLGLTGFPATSSIVVNAQTPPAAPSNLAASARTSRRIDLTWINAATNASSVTVERCAGSQCTGFAAVAALAGTATSWTDAGVKSRSTYRYRVYASNATGRSA